MDGDEITQGLLDSIKSTAKGTVSLKSIGQINGLLRLNFLTDPAN